MSVAAGKCTLTSQGELGIHLNMRAEHIHDNERTALPPHSAPTDLFRLLLLLLLLSLASQAGVGEGTSVAVPLLAKGVLRKLHPVEEW